MKPHIFKQNQIDFDGSGLGALQLTPSCIVKQALNGTYELSMQILKSDPLFNAVSVGAIILAKPNMTDETQPFVIEQISKDIDGLVEVYATHIAQYRSKLIPVMPYDATDLSDAISKAITNSVETNIFNLTTNKSVSTPYSLIEPRSFRELLGGKENSLLDVYGGEYLFDRLNISLLNRRGRPNAFRVAYGRNMTTYNEKDEFDWTNSITGILPYYKGQENDQAIVVVGDVQYSQYANLFPFNKTIAYDFTQKFTATPTVAELNQVAIEYLSSKGLPLVNIEASFEDISTLPYYSDLYTNINSLQLGDEIQIVNSEYNTFVTSRIREMEFDVLLERYSTITIGDATTTINQAISNASGNNVVNYYGGSGGWFVDEYSQHQGATPINADYLNGYTAEQVNSMNFKTIWTNPSPSASFSSQQIDIDYSKYRFLLVIFKPYAPASMKTSLIVDVNDVSTNYTMFFSVYSRNGYRNFTLYNDKSKIVFAGCNYYETYGGSASSRDDMGVPIKIIGIY